MVSLSNHRAALRQKPDIRFPISDFKKNVMLKINLLAVFTLIISISCSVVNPLTDIDRRSFKSDLLSQINNLRRKGCYCGSTKMPPAAPVIWNDELAAAATYHARDMARHKYFSHNSRDGRTLKDRIYKAGYTFKGLKSIAFGENIAYGQHSVNEVMESWIKSERHCKNLMNPGFKEVGVAEADLYWVQDFGGRVSW
jgi:uncharacterized protein YkwD